MTISLTPWTYEIVGDDIHVYDETGTELTSSPHTVPSQGFDIPRDITPLIAEEMSVEYKNNGFTERMQKMLVILSDESLLEPE